MQRQGTSRRNAIDSHQITKRAQGEPGNMTHD